MKSVRILKKSMVATMATMMVLSSASIMAADYDNHWAEEAIRQWNGYGVIGGYGGDVFKPNNKISRAEFAALITRLFGLKDVKDSSNFTDVATTAWYAEDVAKVSAAGIMNGASGEFNPKGYVTREEVAVTLVNAFKLVGKGKIKFSDQEEIATWAQEAVGILGSNGYAQGYPGNKFAPKSNITRAEVVKLLDNIVEELAYTKGLYTKNINGSLVINTTDIVVDGIKVENGVYLAQGIGRGDATIKNTKVGGNIFVSGGGAESIHFEKVEVAGKVIVDCNAAVRLVAKDSNFKVEVKNNQTLILTGNYSEVVMPADSSVDLKGATVDKLTIVAKDDEKATINIDKNSLIKDLVIQSPTIIKGKGEIELLVVESNGVASEIKPNKVKVKKGVEEPKLPEITNGDGSSNPIAPQVNAIQVEAITVIGEKEDKVNIPESIVKINGTDITVDLRDRETIKRKLPKVIIGGEVKFSNLKERDKISSVIELAKFEDVKISDTVEKDGLVSYDIKELAERMKDEKPTIIEKLKQKGLYSALERRLKKFDLSLEEDYLLDGNIDVDKLYEKVVQILDYIQENKESKNIAGIIEQIEMELEAHSVDIDVEAKEIKGKISVETKQLKKTEYSVTIKY